MTEPVCRSPCTRHCLVRVEDAVGVGVGVGVGVRVGVGVKVIGWVKVRVRDKVG